MNNKLIPIIYKGEIIDYQGVNSTPKSYTEHYTGQLFDNGIIHVACILGICTVKMIQYNGNNAVEIIKIVVPFEQEQKDCREKNKGKYISRVFDIPDEKMVYIEYFNITNFIDSLLIKCKLNTQSPYYVGRTLKSLASMIFSEKATYTIKMTYEGFLELIQNTVKDSYQDKFNLGVLAERAILKSRKAFSDRQRENDGYYNGKPVELKTNLSATLRRYLATNGISHNTIEKSSGRSQSNLLVRYAPKKDYTWK